VKRNSICPTTRRRPQQCPDDAGDDVAKDSETVTFDHYARYKTSDQSKQDNQNLSNLI